MSDVINGVPRELLEFIVANARGVERERMDELRALLTAQPQASAAQSAPAGEREAFEAAYQQSWGHFDDLRLGIDEQGRYRSASVNEALVMFQAGAAWQRAQSAPVVPEGELPWTGEQLARAWYLAEYGPGHDLAPGYAVAFARELAAMLAAAPQPAPREWPVVHTSVGCIACEGSPAGDNNPCHICGATQPTAQSAPVVPEGWRIERTPDGAFCLSNDDHEHRSFFAPWGHKPARAVSAFLEAMLAAAPAQPAAQDQGEVQRLREALEDCADRLALLINSGRHKLLDVVAEEKARAALSASAEGKNHG